MRSSDIHLMFIFDHKTIAVMEFLIINSDSSPYHLQKSSAAGDEMMLQYRAIGDDAGIYARILIDGKAVILSIMGGNTAERCCACPDK